VQAAEGAQLTSCQWVSSRRAVFCPGDREHRSREVDLGPLQVADFGGSQSMPEGQQDHSCVAVRPTVALAALDQLFDLAFGEVFPGSEIFVFGSARRHFPFFSGWRYDFQGWFGHMESAFSLSLLCVLEPINGKSASAEMPFAYAFFGQSVSPTPWPTPVRSEPTRMASARGQLRSPEPPARASPRDLATGIDAGEIDGPVWSVSDRGTAGP
jgi:hypothetical protein